MTQTARTVGLAVLLGLGATPVQAAPINLPPGPVFIQSNNLEQIDTTLSNSIAVPGGAIDVTGDGVTDTLATEGNWGVFNVSSMQLGAVATAHEDISGGPIFFFDDGPGGVQGQVTGIFYGIQLTSGTTATSGWLDLYWQDAGADTVDANDLAGITYLPSARTAANLAGEFTAGQRIARMAFTPGIISNDNTTTIESDIDLGTITGGGNADSFADVIDINDDGVIDALDGVWAPRLNGDWFFVDVDGDGIFGETGERRDFRFGKFFNFLQSWDANTANPCVAGQEICGLRSNDPARVFAVAVPEPPSVSLMGIALLLLGLGSIRRLRG